MKNEKDNISIVFEDEKSHKINDVQKEEQQLTHETEIEKSFEEQHLINHKREDEKKIEQSFKITQEQKLIDESLKEPKENNGSETDKLVTMNKINGLEKNENEIIDIRTTEIKQSPITNDDFQKIKVAEPIIQNQLIEQKTLKKVKKIIVIELFECVECEQDEHIKSIIEEYKQKILQEDLQ